MNETAIRIHCRWFQFRIQQLLVLTLAVSVAVPLVGRARERWKTLPERPSTQSNFSGSTTKPDGIGVRGLSLDNASDLQWIHAAFVRSELARGPATDSERSTHFKLAVAVADETALADKDQDRERRKRIQLEKTLDVWDYPTTRQEMLGDNTLTIETIEDARERARATDPPAGDIPTFGIDQTSSILAPELNLSERERLEWMRIQASVDKPLIFNP